MVTAQDLHVRRSSRHDVALPARIEIAEEHRSAVGLKRVGDAADGPLNCTLVDASVGGLGLVTDVLLPRRTVISVRVFGIDGVRQVLDTTVRVQRVLMTDRRPGYLIGTSFERSGPEADRAIDAFFEALDSVG